MPKQPVRHSFLEVLKALNRARVRYVVAGGVAVNLESAVIRVVPLGGLNPEREAAASGRSRMGSTRCRSLTMIRPHGSTFYGRINLHGVDRTTHDLDVYADLAAPNLIRAMHTLTALGYRPTIPVAADAIADRATREGWIREKNMKVFSLLDPRDPLHPVDVFVIQPIPFEQVWKRRKVVRAAAARVPLISIADLVRLKRIAGREQDRWDILSLRRLKDEKA